MTEEEILPFCECGKCGLRVTKKGNRFIHGHNQIGVPKPPRTPEHSAALSESLKNSEAAKAHNESMRGVPLSQEHSYSITKALRNSDAVKEYAEARRGVPHSSERIDAMSEGMKNSEAAKASQDRQRGGQDIVMHHYIYDHSDLSKYTMKMTRSAHARLHNNMRKSGIKVPHIKIIGDII